MVILQIFAATVAAVIVGFAAAHILDRREQARLRRERIDRRLDDAARDLPWTEAPNDPPLFFGKVDGFPDDLRETDARAEKRADALSRLAKEDGGDL